MKKTWLGTLRRSRLGTTVMFMKSVTCQNGPTIPSIQSCLVLNTLDFQNYGSTSDCFWGGKNSPFLLLKKQVRSNMIKYLGQLDSNYISFWNTEIFRKYINFRKIIILKESKESDGIFGKYHFWKWNPQIN